MNDAVIVALITSAAAVVGEWLISKRTEKDRDVKEAVRHEQLCGRLSKLENEIPEIKQDLKEHNGYAQKFVQMHDDIMGIRQDVALIKQDNQHIKEKIRQYHG